MTHFYNYFRSFSLTILAGSVLTACASTKELGYSAAAPLRDLNIGTRPVPGQLANLNNPYGTDTQTSCSAIFREAKQISDALSRNNRRYAGTRRDNSTAGGQIGNVADVAVESATTFWIPFRGLIRQISGAAGRERKAIAADARGRERLGFLIGMGTTLRCPGFDLPPPPIQRQLMGYQPYAQGYQRPYAPNPYARNPYIQSPYARSPYAPSPYSNGPARVYPQPYR